MATAVPVPLPPPATGLTFEEFLARSDEDTWAEWVDGEVIDLMTATNWHQGIVSFLSALLQFWIEAHEGGRVFVAPFLMRLRSRPSGREPDVLYIAPENLGRLQDVYLDGPSDIVVEVVSPESRRRDRDVKFFEYERAGVREYWLIDPDNQDAEFYRRDDTGVFRRVPVEDDGIYRSAVLAGFGLDVNWLWRRPLPTLMSVLKAWGLT